MKYTVNFLENKVITIAGEQKNLKEGSFIDESGNSIDATIWQFDKDGKEFPNWSQIAPGATIEANPWSKPGSDKITLYAPKLERNKPSTYSRSAVIEKAQERKEKSIHEAQDRSAWMWAKNNAALLIANHPTYKFVENVEEAVEELATKIYNFEPLTPF